MGRTVDEIAVELDCDNWPMINATVIAYGTALVDDPDRIGGVTALGLDETLFARGAKAVAHPATGSTDATVL